MDGSFTTDSKIIMSGLQKNYCMFHEITVGATCIKRATYKEQAAEFLEEANALNTDAVIFGLKKRLLQGHVQLDDALVYIPNARISVLFGKVLQATYSRLVNIPKTLSAYTRVYYQETL
jgi:hypothetical protein